MAILMSLHPFPAFIFQVLLSLFRFMRTSNEVIFVFFKKPGTIDYAEKELTENVFLKKEWNSLKIWSHSKKEKNSEFQGQGKSWWDVGQEYKIPFGQYGQEIKK